MEILLTDSKGYPLVKRELILPYWVSRGVFCDTLVNALGHTYCNGDRNLHCFARRGCLLANTDISNSDTSVSLKDLLNADYIPIK